MHHANSFALFTSLHMSISESLQLLKLYKEPKSEHKILLFLRNSCKKTTKKIILLKSIIHNHSTIFKKILSDDKLKSLIHNSICPIKIAIKYQRADMLSVLVSDSRLQHKAFKKRYILQIFESDNIDLIEAYLSCFPTKTDTCNYYFILAILCGSSEAIRYLLEDMAGHFRLDFGSYVRFAIKKEKYEIAQILLNSCRVKSIKDSHELISTLSEKNRPELNTLITTIKRYAILKLNTNIVNISRGVGFNDLVRLLKNNERLTNNSILTHSCSPYPKKIDSLNV